MNKPYDSIVYRRYASYSKTNRRNIVRDYKDKKGGKCSLCGYNKNYAALDFHHIDSKKKKFSFQAGLFLSYTSEKIEKELNKCILLILKNLFSFFYFIRTKPDTAQ